MEERKLIQKKRTKKIVISNLWENYSTIGIMLVIAIIFNSISKGFISLGNLEKIVIQNLPLMLIVLGTAFVMIVGGIDLSIGYQISLVSAVLSYLSVQQQPGWLAITGSLAVGLGCGLINGILVGYLKIVPFAATIATQIIFHGISYLVSKGSMISNIPTGVKMLAKSHFGNIQNNVWLVVAGIVVFQIVMKYSYAGKYFRAVGLNEKIAASAGVPTRFMKCLAYCIASIFYAIAGLCMVSVRGYSGSEIGIGMEIQGIAAAYIGGVLGKAEQPSVLSLILGVLTIGMIANGLPKIGISEYVQYVFTGVILVISMVIHNKKR